MLSVTFADYSGEYMDVCYLALLTFQCFERFRSEKIDEVHREIQKRNSDSLKGEGKLQGENTFVFQNFTGIFTGKTKACKRPRKLVISQSL